MPKDISKLQPHEIQAYINEPFKRSGDLLQGYRIALDPRTWEEERDAATAKAAEEEANAEIDQLQSDGEEEADDDDEKKTTKARKRKRESESAPIKPKAKPKAKKDSAEPASKKRSSSTSRSKKNGTKSKAMVESEDEGGADAEDEDAGPSKKASPPPTKKVKRDNTKDGEEEPDCKSALQYFRSLVLVGRLAYDFALSCLALLNSDPEAIKVRDWRHKLQKAFLNTKANPPKDEVCYSLVAID